MLAPPSRPSSSRRITVKLACILGCCGATTACAKPSPVAWATQEQAPRRDAEVWRKTAQLSLRSLSSSALAQVARALDDFAVRAERRAQPLIAAGGDDKSETLAELERRIQTHLPTLNAAAHLAHGRYAADDGLLVTVGRTCDDAPRGARCFPLWQRGDDTLARRARFMAWPFSCAIKLRVQGGRAGELATALRQAADRSDGLIAFVLGGSEPDGAAAVREQARRVLTLAERHGTKTDRADLLAGLAAAPSPSTLAALDRTFARAADEIVVVPRMSALSRLHGFEDEVQDIVNRDAFSISWRHHVSPLE